MTTIQVDAGWGPDALAAWTAVERATTTLAVVVVIDVLSFSTSVDIATGRGAVVFPWHTIGAEAEAEAVRRDAVLARGRRPTPDSPWCLSPASLQTIPAGTRLVLPSPNGATLSRSAQRQLHVEEQAQQQAASRQVRVLAGCMRNADALARYVAGMAASAVSDDDVHVLLLAAGEWNRPTASGVWRTALEDWLGAGAIATALRLAGAALSADASAAATRFMRSAGTLHATLQACQSGQELLQRDFADDVYLAAQLNVSSAVPRLTDGYADATVGERSI